MPFSQVERYGVLHRHVVGVGDPADVLGVGHVGAREGGGAPAVDGVAHVLSAADEQREHRQQHHRPQVVEAVAPVVVARTAQARPGCNAAQPANPETRKIILKLLLLLLLLPFDFLQVYINPETRNIILKLLSLLLLPFDFLQVYINPDTRKIILKLLLLLLLPFDFL